MGCLRELFTELPLASCDPNRTDRDGSQARYGGEDCATGCPQRHCTRTEAAIAVTSGKGGPTRCADCTGGRKTADTAHNQPGATADSSFGIAMLERQGQPVLSVEVETLRSRGCVLRPLTLACDQQLCPSRRQQRGTSRGGDEEDCVACVVNPQRTSGWGRIPKHEIADAQTSCGGTYKQGQATTNDRLFGVKFDGTAHRAFSVCGERRG